MSASLKYFFVWKDGILKLDSLACIDGQPVEEPPDFLKWYEDGDLGGPADPDLVQEMVAHGAIIQAMFADRKVNFSVEEILRNRQ